MEARSTGGMPSTGGSQRGVQRRPANVPGSSGPAPSAPPPAATSSSYGQPQASSHHLSTASSSSARSQSYKRGNHSQQLSQIEKSVTHLLVATKQLLETLTQWSRHNATEAEVSDVYVRLGYEFNIASRAFNAIGVETSDLGNVPDLLRAILEDTLSQEASPASLDRYLPRIRDIIINLLHGLKRKQQKLRQKHYKEEVMMSGGGASARQDSIASSASGDVSLNQSVDDGSGRFSGNSTVSQHMTRTGSKESRLSDDTGIPARGTSMSGERASPVRYGNLTQMGSKPRTSSMNRDGHSNKPPGASSSFSTGKVQPSPAMTSYASDGTLNGDDGSGNEGPAAAFLPPPPPPKQQDALAALQRGGDLERRASRRYSAYQISKHLGASPNGVPMLPPAQHSPIPNRGRDVRESMNAVRVRGSMLHSRMRSPHPSTTETTSAAHAAPSHRISEESTQGGSASTGHTYEGNTTLGDSSANRAEETYVPSPAETGKDESTMESTRNFSPEKTSLDEDTSHNTTEDSRLVAKSAQREVARQPDHDRSRLAPSPAPDARGTTPERSPEPGKELTLFLQYKSKIKKFVLSEGLSELSIARLQLAFIEKFSWNTHSNGNDLPDIYIQDPVSGVRHELQDLGDVRDRSVLVLNVEPLDEVKRHIDERVADLGKLVGDVRHVIEGQQATIQLVSDRQTEAAKELARLAAAPAPTPTRMSFVEAPVPNGARGPIASGNTVSQLNDIQSLRRDLAVVRQTYSSFVSDIQAAMAEIRTKASSVKSVAVKAAVPTMDSESGRAYVNKGKKELGEVSDALVNKVDDLQDIVEDLRKDVVTRGVRPLPRQLETVGKDISVATAELKKIQEFLRREKPKWSKIWEKELQLVCDDRDLLTMQEALAADLQDDLENAAQTFALVEEATKEQMKDGQGSIPRSTSRTLNPVSVDPSVDPQMAKEGVLGEVRALQPNHETRLEAIERAERARQKELESRRGGEFQKELGSFVGEGRLKKSGGFEEVERQRKARDDRIRREAWERQNASGKGKDAENPGTPSSDQDPQGPPLEESPKKSTSPGQEVGDDATDETKTDGSSKTSSWLPSVFGI